VIDPGKQINDAIFENFQGLWLVSKPSGAVACVMAHDGKLLIPYSFGGSGKLTGHYYDSKVNEKTLFCRFESFDSSVGGVMFLTVAPNETLTGGRWMNDQIPETARQDVSQWSESLPGMQPVVWIRILNQETPQWAKKYFEEEWPNKP
jgi:hypothetical protein